MKKCTRMVGLGFGEAAEGGYRPLSHALRTSDNIYYVYFILCRRAHTPTGPFSAGKKVARSRESGGGP
jgi:hypothetical protein